MEHDNKTIRRINTRFLVIKMRIRLSTLFEWKVPSLQNLYESLCFIPGYSISYVLF